MSNEYKQYSPKMFSIDSMNWFFAIFHYVLINILQIQKWLSTVYILQKKFFRISYRQIVMKKKFRSACKIVSITVASIMVNL